MKELLTVRIVQALDNNLIKEILAALKNEKRKTLLLLFKWILENKETEFLKREIVFEKLFIKKWTKESDYLLRNELKLLKDKIEEIYIAIEHKQISKEFKNNCRLKLYNQLKITDEYQTVFTKIVEDNKLHHQHYNNIEISFDYAHFIRLNIPNYEDRLKLMIANQLLYEQSLDAYVSEKHSKHCLMQSHMLFQQKQADNKPIDTEFKHDIICTDTLKFKTAFTNYHIAYANAYKNYDTSTILEWENIYELLKNIPDSATDMQTEYSFTLGNLATICSIRTEYKKSDYYFSILFRTLPTSVTQQNVALTLNYITNLNKLKEYQRCKQAMQQAIQLFGNKIRSFSQFKTQEIVVACYLEDVEQLGKLLAINFESLQPFERIFYRFFYCIYFLQKEDYELALLEIQNLQRSKLMNEIDTHFGEIAQFLYVSIKHINTHGFQTKIPKKCLTEIEKANQKIIKANIPMFLNYAPYLWMKEKLHLDEIIIDS